jgi:hypothetical protein
LRHDDVVLESVLGTHRLRGQDELTIGELLAANRIPETLCQAYAVNGGSASPLPLGTRLADIDDESSVIVRLIRNTLLPAVLAEQPGGTPPDTRGVSFRSLRPAADETVQEVHAVVDSERARQMVRDQVLEFEQTFGLSARGCVFGVSGGGDSNALAYGLRSALPRERLMAFTLVFGAVFSENAAVRATVLCQDLGIEHRVLRPPDIASLLNVRSSLDALYDDFRSEFGEEALHFFGTFLILRCARRLADQRQFGDLAFGYNREDLLAEALFMVMNGNAPLAIPVRPIGPHRVVMPVWKVPKLLLDACHPQFSLENYRERDAFTTRQRSLAFFLAHAADSAYPSFGLSLLTGLSRAFDGRWGSLEHDAESDLFLTVQADPETVETVREMLARHLG